MTESRTVLLLHGVQSSRSTWWRMMPDLADLGWTGAALDLLGHGERAAAGIDPLTIDALAEDVADQLPGPVDLIVGHSLGAIVALTLAGLRPDYCAGVVIEDPPGLGGALDPREVAADIERSVAAARADPTAARRAVLQAHPSWAPVDATTSVQSQRALAVERVAAMLRSADWDLPALVGGCPVPVGLLLADGPESALLEPDRQAVINLLPSEWVVQLGSGHSIHRDRPALWLHHVLRFADAVAAGL